MLYRATQWLESTAWSTAIRESLWVYPIIETIHVLMLCLFLGLITMLDLRLVGAAFRSVPVSQIVKRLLPWALAGFGLSVITGLLLLYATPVRIVHNIFFRFKLVALLLAGVNAWAFHNGIYRRIAEWDLTSPTPSRVKLAGFISLGSWMSVVVAGRLIAYNWFDCGRAQAPILDLLAGCNAMVP